MKKIYLLFILIFSLADFGKSVDIFNKGYNILLLDDTKVTVYPNPTTENFSVKVELDKNSEVEVTVFNAIGKIVYSSREAGVQPTYIKLVPFDDQPSGIYFVNVKAGEIKSIERLIKIK